MIILPKNKKRKNMQAITQVKITSTPGGKIVITGDGYINWRCVGLMTADKKGELFIFDNAEGFTVQFTQSTWSVPLHIKSLSVEQLDALKPYIDKGSLTVTKRLFKHKDGHTQPAVCISKPEIKSATNEQISFNDEFITMRRSELVELLRAKEA